MHWQITLSNIDEITPFLFSLMLNILLLYWSPRVSTTQQPCLWLSPPPRTWPWMWFPCANGQTPEKEVSIFWFTLIKKNLGRKIGSIKHCFNNTGYKSGAVETALVLAGRVIYIFWQTGREWEEFWLNLGDRDECVHDGFFLNNVIGSLVVIGVLQLVCFLAKQSLPESGFHLCLYRFEVKFNSWQRIVPVGEHSRASVPALRFGLLQRSDL